MTLRRICVFCGSSPGADSEYAHAARQLGLALAERGIQLVYGGGRIGLMGRLARTVMDVGGTVIGVIPRQLVERDLAFMQVSDLRVVGTMHERKALMAELADGFIALPGGLGTIEELFEALTWAQLGMHSRPCGLIDVAGYYRRLMDFVDYAVEQRFVEPRHRDMLLVDSDPARLLERFHDYHPPPLLDKAKWALSMGAM
ncbi:MAG: TIGR00730 family Rossman fold protein [Vicinamibacteria bacterium]|nr:TIGR00730 family Rossman fold protein [Vicinamibacteria bacterium]